MNRFSGFPYPGGVIVLDGWTGRVLRVPADGTAPTVLLEAQATPDPSAIAAALPEIAEISSASEIAAAPSVAEAPRHDALTALDREVVATFPYPVARTWESYLSEDDPRTRCKLLVDTFTGLLKLWALQTASEYLDADEVRDAHVNRTLARDFARPLISAWNLMLQRAIPVLSDAGVAPFTPELWEAYAALEAKCRERFVVQVPYEDEHGNRRTKRSKLGKIQALIRYRNGLAHGYHQSRDDARRDLETYEPLMRDVLQAARFTARYPLFLGLSAAQGELEAVRLMGARPAGEPERLRLDLDLGASPLFLFDETARRALPFGPLLDVDPVDGAAEAAPGLGRDVLLYDGHTRTTLIYAAVHGGHAQKQARMAGWKAQLAEKALEVEPLTRATLSVEALVGAARHKTEQALSHLEGTGKLIPETYVSRAALRAVLERFDRGDFRGLVLGGGGGMGKSTLLAMYARERLEAGDCVLLYRGSALHDVDLSARILRDLATWGMYFEDFLAAADGLFGEARVRVIVDAVDEHPTDPAGLVHAIDAVVRQAESYPWLRVLVGVREPAYLRLPPDARFGGGPGARYLVEERSTPSGRRPSILVDVPGFSDDETAEVYERYRGYRRADPSDEAGAGAFVYRPETPFEELHPRGSTRELLRTPLMLRLILSAFHRRPLPSEVSWDEAMRLYVDHVIVRRDGPGRPAPERLRFLMGLVRQLDARAADAVERDALYAVAPLRAALENPQKDSPYVQLLDLGILVEEWEADTCRVRFAFDGLLEYFLAELHDPRVERARDLLEQAGRALSFSPLRTAVGTVIRRALAQHRVALIREALDEAEGAEAELLVELVAEASTQLARFGDEAFEPTLEALARPAAERPARVALRVFDGLFGRGHPLAERAARIAEVAATDAALRAAALGRRAQHGERSGALDEALQCYRAARDAASEAGDVLLASQVGLGEARILMDRGELDAARSIADAAARAAAEGDALADAAEARRLQATLAQRAGDPAAQAELLAESIDLSERAGDPVQTAKGLNNLARVLTAQGRRDEAEEAYLRALAICDEQGDAASAAVIRLNLATAFTALGELTRARLMLEEGLRAFETIGHHLGRALAVTHTGVLDLLEGALEDASARFREALRLFEARGEPVRIAYAHWFLGTLAAERGEDARPHLAPIASAEGAQPRLHHAALEARVAVAEDAGAGDAISRLEAEADALGAHGWDVEDGPLLAYLDAAAWADRTGDRAWARALAERADACARGRPFHRSDELEDLLDRLGVRPRVNVATRGES